MTALAGSYYLISTVAFCLVCTVIGVRLARLSRRTGARPELYLGITLFLTGGLGYGLVIGAAIARTRLGIDTPAIRICGLAGLGLHHLGVAASMAFILTVFRPTERWARALAATMLTVLGVSWIALLAMGGAVGSHAGGMFYWLGFSITATYPFWIAGESLRYWTLMKRRTALGLADPVVTNRFLLMAAASSLAAAAIWTAALPGLLQLPAPEQARVAPLVLSVTATAGIGSVACYWLAFFPPGWYLRRLGTARAA
jgi:hypothetical protein